MRLAASTDLFFHAFFLCLLLGAPCARAGERAVVKPRQTVRELLDSKGSESAPPAALGTGSLLLKLVLSVGAIGLLGSGLIFISRKYLSSPASLHSSGDIEVTGRAALSSKHLVFVLRVGERQIVVGVSGDGMSPLAVLGESGGRSCQASSAERQMSFREADLIPYRRQMDRLRGLFRGRFQHEGDLPAGGSSKES